MSLGEVGLQWPRRGGISNWEEMGVGHGKETE